MMKKLVLGALCITLSAGVLHGQVTHIVPLNSARLDYSPRTYYINNVGDERNDKTDIGRVTDNGKTEKLVLAGGTATGLSRFISANMKQDASQQPIELRIVKLNFDIKKKGDHWYLNSDVNFAFYVGERKLAEYDGGGKGEFNTDPATYAAGFIRQTLATDLKKFDAWWAQNRDRVATSSAVRVNFRIGKITSESRLIVYSKQRPLSIADFQGAVRRHNENEMAETYSGNRFEYTVETIKGQLVVNYIITPYFDKSKSWFRQDEDNARILAHEQLHYDITALKTCEMIERASKQVYTKDNYKELLDKISDQLATETNEMQERYDAETNHGISTTIQKQWEAKVKQQLASVTCY